MSGKIIGNEPCPRCREGGRDKSGDHLMIFQDGGGYCNRCEYHRKGDGDDDDEEFDLGLGTNMLKNPDGLVAESIPSRGLDVAFVEMYGGRVEHDPTNGTQSAVWWPRHKGGKQVGWKRAGLTEKTYHAFGDGKDSDLFGMQLDGGTKLCIITEGEADAVATKQMLRTREKNYRVVSLVNGALAGLSQASYEFLASFETVIVATDMDDKGDEAAEKIAELLGIGKCKRAVLPYKDANDCLLAGKVGEFFNALMSARIVTVDGIVLGSDTWDQVLTEHNRKNSGGIPFPWEGLNTMAYGSRVSEIDTWCSGTGMGKTQVMRELMHHWSIVHGVKVGVLALEESLTTTIVGQMSICANLPLHLPEVKATVSDEDLRGYWEQATANDNLVCLDHWGSVGEEQLISKIRYLASGMGCKYIVLDHLSILVSEIATDGDERKNIDVLMTKLKRLTEELKIHISLVTHLNTPNGGKSFEEGGVPNLNNLRGSRSIGQLSHGVYALSRNQQDPDPIRRNISMLTILKCRFSGKTGNADIVMYDPDTGRLVDAPLSLEDYKDGYGADNIMDQRG